MPSVISELAFVVYPVSNIEVAKAFYAGILNLRETVNWQNQWVEYSVGQGTVAITTMFGWGSRAKRTMVALEVTDFVELSKGLEAAGVHLIWGPRYGDWCTSGMISDPDGNRIILHHRKR